VPVTAVVEYSVLPQLEGVANASDTINFYIQKVFETYFSYSSMRFGQVIYPEVVDGLLRQIDGVRNIRLKYFHRTADNVNERRTLTGQANEIFAFPAANITSTRLSSSSTLSNLTAAIAGGGGTLTLYPTTFASNITSYNLVVSTATSVTLTVTKTNALSSVVVLKNGLSTGVSGPVSDVYTISSVTNADVYTITVTSQDGVNVTVYTVTVTK
jgi:hypothetical protein